MNSRIERRQTRGRKESDNEENNPKNTTTVRKTSKDKPGRHDTRNGIDAANRNQTPKSQKGMRPRASGPQTWRWVWVPQEGGALRPRAPKGGSGLHAGTVRWRERRGVGKAEVPGEEDSEARPKGLTPV